MKKKILSGIIMVPILSLAFFIGFKVGYNRLPVSNYLIDKGYGFLHEKGGIITDKETAEKIGDAVLIEKHLRGNGPLNVDYEERETDGLWTVSVVNYYNESDNKISVIISRYGDIEVVASKK